MTHGASRSDGSAARDSINGHILDLVEGERGVDPAWMRRRAVGLGVAIAYVVLGLAAACAGAAFRIGPFGALSGLELLVLGVESPILSGAFGLSLLALPIIWAMRPPRDIDHPTLLGVQDAFDPARHPRFIASSVRKLRAARLGFWLYLALAALALAGGAAGWKISQRAGPDAGKPLPLLALAQLVAPGARLPPFARLVDGVDQRSSAWSCERHVRQTRYRDIYIPLTDPSWRRGDRVDVLELDRLLPDAAPTEQNRLDPPGPREGALRTGLPPWLLKAMRRSGLPAGADVAVLERRPLHGLVPGPDWVTSFVWLDMAGATAFVAGLMAWRMWRLAATLKPAVAPKGPQVAERWKAALILPVELALMAGADHVAGRTPRFIAGGVTAPGIVVSQPFGMPHPVVRFRRGQGETLTYSQGGEITQSPGDRVSVRYDPADPEGSASLDTFAALGGRPSA